MGCERGGSRQTGSFNQSQPRGPRHTAQRLSLICCGFCVVRIISRSSKNRQTSYSDYRSTLHVNHTFALTFKHQKCVKYGYNPNFNAYMNCWSEVGTLEVRVKWGVSGDGWAVNERGRGRQKSSINLSRRDPDTPKTVCL